MNYMKVYVDLIHKAQERQINNPLTCYKENHHIIPTCIGGDNSLDNRVDLIGREHFIAHALLCYIFPNNHSISLAFNIMRNVRSSNKYISSYKYNKLREEFGRLQSIFMIGNTYALGSIRTEEQKLEISKRHTGKILSEDNKLAVKLAHTGKPRSNETKLAISRSLTGKIMPLVTRLALSLANENKVMSDKNRTLLSERSKGNKHGSNPNKIECIYCKEFHRKSTLTTFHGPNPIRGDITTSQCRIKSIDLGTWLI